MRRILKVIHLVGLATLLGGLLSLLVGGAVGGAPGSAAFVLTRAQNVAVTQALTLPGLALAAASGFALTWTSRLSPVRHRWLAVHAGLAVVAGILVVALLLPAGSQALEAARAATASGATVTAAEAARAAERIVGAVAIALTLAIIAFGVYKPRLAMGSPPRNQAEAS